MSQSMDRIPAPPRLQCSLFCICRDSIHVQVYGSNPGPPPQTSVLTLLHLLGFDPCPGAWIESRAPQCSFASARIRSRSRNLDRIPALPDFSAQDSPGFDRGPGTWIKSSDQTRGEDVILSNMENTEMYFVTTAHWLSSHFFVSAGIRFMFRCMDRIPAPPVPPSVSGKMHFDKNMCREAIDQVFRQKKVPFNIHFYNLSCF